MLMVMSDLPNGRALAKCFLVDTDNTYAVNQRVCIFRTSAHDARYLKYILNRNPYFMAFDDGVQQTHLLNGPIKKCPLVLPKRREQVAIADVLSDADDLVAALERLIAKKQAIKQGMMQQLLTGNIRLPRHFGTWRSDRIGSVCVVDPESLSPATVAASAQIDYISLEDVSKGSVLGSTRYRFGDAPSRARRALTQDDVLFGTVRPNLQSHARYQGGFARPVASTGFAVLRSIPNLTDPSFLSHWVLSDVVSVQIGKIIAGSNYPAVSSKDVRQLNIELPPLEEQVDIGRTLDDADAEIGALKSRLVVTQNIKQGMMQALLTGRTRLMPAEVTA
ncbi:type I restriction enzyme S subunit [Cryobacterium mesophilum]|nr:type I restriction enzyme S subunit [Terrimesophilobacter mesophilus]